MVLVLRCVAVAAGFDIVHCCRARQHLDPVLNNSRPGFTMDIFCCYRPYAVVQTRKGRFKQTALKHYVDIHSSCGAGVPIPGLCDSN